MNAHLDLDELADLLVGEGGAPQLEHLQACARCSGALVDLERAQAPVQAALAALPAPQVPADLPARLDAALRDARGPAAPAPVPRPVPLTGPADPDRQPGRTGAAATSAAGPGRRAAPRRTTTGRRAARWLPAAAVAVGLLALGGAGLAARGGGDDDPTAAGSAQSAAGGAAEAGRTVPTSSTGTDYGAGRDALLPALPALLAAGPRPAALAAGDPLARLRDPAQLADCLSGLADPQTDGQPLALDYARYAGVPALVAVLPTPAPDRLDVFVVGAGCRAGDEQTLLYTRLDRPG